MSSAASSLVMPEEPPSLSTPPGLGLPEVATSLEWLNVSREDVASAGYPSSAAAAAELARTGWGDGGFDASNIWLWPTDCTTIRDAAMLPHFQQQQGGSTAMQDRMAAAAASASAPSGETVPLPGGFGSTDGSRDLASFFSSLDDEGNMMPPVKTKEQEQRETAMCSALAQHARYTEEAARAAPPGVQCRWHKSAQTVGVISNDGHVFTKTAGPRRSRVSDRGARVELASICMVFDSSLRCGGVHRYCYTVLHGDLGAADGAGFVFDSKVRRNNIQRMRSVFLNQRGRICLRNNQHVTKLDAVLPPLTVGVILTLLINLDCLTARFDISSPHGALMGSADIGLEQLFHPAVGMGARAGTPQLRSGFFCAVVTGSITIGIH